MKRKHKLISDKLNNSEVNSAPFTRVPSKTEVTNTTIQADSPQNKNIFKYGPNVPKERIAEMEEEEKQRMTPAFNERHARLRDSVNFV